MTQLSAAVTLVQWTEKHGRRPRDLDARGSGGILWQSTYHRIFGMSSFSHMVDYAFDLASGVSSMASKKRTKPCLNYDKCGMMILDEGKHLRMCSQCKKRIAQEEEEIDLGYFDASIDRVTLNRYGIGRDGWLSDIAEWDE